jgi:ankyrin repeat protein
MIASQNGHLDIVKALLESRAEVNAESNVRNPPSPPPHMALAEPLSPAPLLCSLHTP